MTEQIVDERGNACDVLFVRASKHGTQVGVGYSLSNPTMWFVYDREEESAKWAKRYGPYDYYELAVERIHTL